MHPPRHCGCGLSQATTLTEVGSEPLQGPNICVVRELTRSDGIVLTCFCRFLFSLALSGGPFCSTLVGDHHTQCRGLAFTIAVGPWLGRATLIQPGPFHY